MKRKTTILVLLVFLLVQSLSFATPVTPGGNQKNLPKLILSDYSLSPETPKAGEEFELSMTFFNSNKDYTARNIKVTLTSESPDKEPGSFGVFTPVGSSNTFYFDMIEEQESVEHTVRFRVSPSPPSKNYSLNVLLQYENYQGVQLEAKEVIGIPVVQTPRIMMDDPNVPSEITIDEGLNLSVGFYNTGRDDLKNVMIETTGNFTADPTRYFVGDFASGNSDVFSTLLVAKEAGELSGVISISFEDSTGEEHRLEKTFLTEVLPASEEAPAEQTTLPLPINTIFLGALALLLILVIFFALRWRREKKARKIRDELTIDE